MSAEDKRKLDEAITYDYGNDFMNIRASTISSFNYADITIGDTYECVYMSDGEGGFVDMQQLFSALRDAGIL